MAWRRPVIWPFLALALPLGGCQGLSEAPALALGEAPAVEPSAAYSPLDCRERVERVLAGAEAAASDIALVRIDRAGAPMVVLAPDLPFPAEASREASDRPCLLLVEGQAEGPLERRVGLPEEVQSHIVAGVAREPNPAYEAAKLRAQHAERLARRTPDPGIIRTRDPAVDLVGGVIESLLGGLFERRSARAFDQALDELAETPANIERPRLEPYRFTRTPIVLDRLVTVQVTLVDRERDRVLRAELPHRDQHVLYRYDGLDPRDVNHDEHLAWAAEPARIAALERAPPHVPVSALLQGLLGVDGRRAPGPGIALAEIEPAAPAAFEPALASLVLVEGAGGIAAGFYVARDRVVTDLAALGRGRVADLLLADGTRAAALVVDRDPEHGLALLLAPRPGPPLALAEAISGGPARLLAYDPALAPRAVGVVLGPDLGLEVGDGLGVVDGAPLLQAGQVVAVAGTGRARPAGAVWALLRAAAE